VTITGTFQDGTGSPVNGTAVFTPSATVYAAGVPVLTEATVINASIISGALHGPNGGSLTLLATDNSGLTYEGLTGFFFWNVTITVEGAEQSWSFFLPHSPSTIDLYELANTGAGGGGISLPLALTEGGTGVDVASNAALLAAIGAAALAGFTLTGWIAPAVVGLTQSGGAVAVNAALGNDFRLTLTASGWQVSNPTNPVDGQRIDFQFTQDSTGSRTITWGSAYNFGASGAPTLTTTASKTDVVGFIYSAAKSQWLYAGGVFGY
jgi:hypothetical protein